MSRILRTIATAGGPPLRNTLYNHSQSICQERRPGEAGQRGRFIADELLLW